MKVKSFYKVLIVVLTMLALAVGQTAKAVEVTIGSLDGASSNEYLPMNSLYEYSYTQQIFHASEIGTAGTIGSITVWMYGNADLFEMPFDIYLTHTDKESFDSTTDWIPVSSSDMVYSGTVTVHNTSAEAYTFELDIPFDYNGTDNLAVCFCNRSGQWKGGLRGMTATLDDGTYSLYARRDGTAYDPYNISSTTATGATSARNVITFDITEANVEGEVTLNDGTTTNGLVPIYGYWADQLTASQFIIEAADLSTIANSSIDSLTFYAEQSDISWGNATFDVYLGEVSQTSFADATFVDWGTLANVYSGSLTISDNMMKIALNAPYRYLGGNLLVGFNQTTKGSYQTTSWYGVEATGAAIGGYLTSNGTPSFSVHNFRPKVTFSYISGGVLVCPKPKAVKASELVYDDNTGTFSDTITWTSEANAWNLRYKLQDANNWTTVAVTGEPNYLLTGLSGNCTYEVQVQTDCGGGSTSDWTSSLLLTTPICTDADQGTIRYELTDDYGDGWDNSKIRVVHHETGTIVAELTLASGSSAEGTFKLCCGEDYDFIWVSGSSWDYECGYIFYDVNDEEIFSGSNALDTYFYTMNCTITTCKMPKDLALASTAGPRSAELQWTPGSNDQTTWDIAYKADGDADFTIVEAVTENPYTLTGLEPETDYTVKVRGNCGGGEVSNWSKGFSFTTNTATPTPVVTEVVVAPNTAEISWLDWADEYELRYALSPSLTPTNETLLQYDNDNFSTTYGGSSEETWTWGVMYPGSLVTGNVLTGISIYEKASNNTGDITINIYEGGDNAPGNLLYSETVTPEALDDFHDIEFKSPVFLTPGQNLWITLTETGTYVLNVCDDGSEPNNQWIYYGGAWNKIADLVSADDVGWMIRGNMATIDFNSDNITWTTVTCDEATALLTGLQAETDYIVQVRGNYGTDGYSAWRTGVFTTKAGTEEPFNLATTVITPASATLNWTGYQNSYNVQYRKKEVASPTESATIILTAGDIWGDGSGYQMLLDADATAYGTIIPNEGGLTGGGDVSDDTYAEFEYKIPENADGVLTTENIVLNNSISIKIPAGTYDFCITNPTAGDRMWIVAYTGNVPGRYDDFVFEPGTTYEFTISYNGTNDGVDLTETLPMGDWITVNNVTNPYQLTGLTPETYYEWQVQGILDGGTTGWSAISNFTTKSTSYDLNGDGNVDFADVATLANIVVGNINQAGYPMTVIDINSDGNISVADVTAFVNMLKAMP